MPNWIIISAITGIYLVAILLVGLAAGRGQKNSLEGYTTGSRDISMIVLFFILGAEIFSAFTFLGAPGEAYRSGAPAMYILAYLSLALVLWYVLGPKIATLGRRYGYITQADLFRDRFKSKALTVIVAISSVVALVPYLTIQITGAGLLFEFATEGNLPFWLGSLAAFGVTTAYVYVSGLKGIGWTNLLQGILMFVVAWAVGIAAVAQPFGTLGEMFTQIQLSKPEFLTLPGGDGSWTWTAYSSAIILSVLGFVMWPHVFMKSYSSGSNRSIKRTVVFYPLYALLVVPIVLAGFAAIMVFSDAPLERADSALLQLIVFVLDLPAWIIGLMLAGAVAAAMSTGANLAHAAATIFIRDFISVVARKPFSDQKALMWTRIAVIVISAISYLFAITNSSSIVQLFLSAYGIVIQFLPLTLAALYWRRANLPGALSGLITGLGVSVLFTYFVDSPFGIGPGLWGFAANIIVFVAVTGLTKPMPRSHTARFAIQPSDHVPEGIEPAEMAAEPSETKSSSDSSQSSFSEDQTTTKRSI
ncbi:sodium:solute symporter family protein [Gulosibacter chungangensis]|uniref:Sodium:solute symporter family protein n=1 Tax=Gulosibacter chungangensis TaxID=979746 RepID=A0A7J5BFA7_9MICO|nr:sodium:solute symporter family protein [Gulosibacter chungangensis]KAB1644956.1 sodium:solute symporter family protein [Gulosibacter chungangensis]